jgi:phosphatidylethanolamine/phosphatidyl-N-methylethanolamine N-methyltransferase
MELHSVERAYARWAPFYDWTFGALLTSARREAARRINALGGALLEVGVGTGLSLPLYGPDLEVSAFDYSHEMLEKACARVERLALGNVVDLRQMDASAMDYGDARFDTVTAMHVLSVVPDPARVLQEMHRVLKPGGHLILLGYFSGSRGVFGAYERLVGPFAHRLGWHFDCHPNLILDHPGFALIQQRRLPPLRMMTLMTLRNVT